ncbi:MAG: PEP-CTERM sorting domain-containing protein [Planctomycetota bacterium]
MFRKLLCTCAILLAFSPSLSAAVVFDEDTGGDLSGAFGAPTLIALSGGANEIFGQMGSNGNTGASNGSDGDYFTFTLAANQTIDSLTIVEYGFSPNDPGRSFMGYVNAASFGGQGGGDVDGFWLFNASDISGQTAGLGGSALGVGGTLGPGEHSFWIQETSGNVVDWGLSFNLVTAIPEPSSALALLGVGACVVVRRRR